MFLDMNKAATAAFFMPKISKKANYLAPIVQLRYIDSF